MGAAVIRVDFAARKIDTRCACWHGSSCDQAHDPASCGCEQCTSAEQRAREAREAEYRARIEAEKAENERKNAASKAQLGDFFPALARFIADAQAMIDKHYAEHYPTQGATLSCEVGPKYVRVVRSDKLGTSRSAHCFIERATGNILKCDGWKRPAKGARGNIYTYKRIEEAMTPHGAHYNYR